MTSDKPNMVERVAKAIYQKSYADRTPWQPPQWDNLDYAIRAQFLQLGKAAIEAMREPTEDMKVLGSLSPGAGGPDGDYSTEVWQAMIDAALEE